MPDEERVTPYPMNQIREPAEEVRIAINPDSVRELAESITAIGQITPIILRDGTPPLEISQGHRRYLAIRMLARPTINAIIRQMDDETNYLARATENLHREDLTIIEEARIYRHLQDRYKMSANKLAKMIGRAPGAISSTLAALTLPEYAQEAIQRRQISYYAVKPLMQIKEPETRDMYLRFACANGITLQVAQGWLDGWKRTNARETNPNDEPIYMDQRRERPIYMECAGCRHPVDIGKMKQLYLCPDCHGYIIEGKEHPAITAEGG